MSSLLQQLDSGDKQSPLPTNVLSTTRSPVMAELDRIVQWQLLHPFESVRELAVRCQRPQGYIAQILATAAYKTMYEKRRKEIVEALGIPSTVEKIEATTALVLERLMEKIASTDDGYLLEKVLGTLLKATGQGGYAPAPQVNTNILVDARQAAILGIREQAMNLAREAGPYPQELTAGREVIESLPTVEDSRQPGFPPRSHVDTSTNGRSGTPVSSSTLSGQRDVPTPSHTGSTTEGRGGTPSTDSSFAEEGVTVYPVASAAAGGTSEKSSVSGVTDSIEELESELLGLPTGDESSTKTQGPKN